MAKPIMFRRQIKLNFSSLTCNMSSNFVDGITLHAEYGGEGIVSTRGDVYSFGILLMETFTRKKPIDDKFSGEMSLKSWVKQSLPSDGVIDTNLLSKYNRQKQEMAAKGCAISILQLALECSSESPEERINMKQVVAKLKKIKIKFLKDFE